MITLTLPLPPGINATYKIAGKRLVKSLEAKAWEESTGWMIKRLCPKEPLTTPISVTMTMYVKHDRDIDSSIKITLDLLQTQKMYKNDKQIKDLTVQKIKVGDNPHMKVSVIW